MEKTAPETIQDKLQPLGPEGLRFSCHPGVSCFTECCRDLKLLLTPYDVLRLKNHLRMQAMAFLDRYTETEFDERHCLPMVYLKMRTDSGKMCPFLTSEGCRVYLDRPAACRTYPLARASRMRRRHGLVEEDYFILREDHCKGFEEDRLWSVNEWVLDQGLDAYHELNNLWMEIITHPMLRQEKALSEKQQQMFFLASYDITRFRDLVMGGRFLRLFELTPDEESAIREDEEELLKLAFKWIRFSLFHEPTLKIRQPGSSG